MKRRLTKCFVAAAGLLLLTATNGFSFGSYGTTVNDACRPAVPYVGNCALCHVSDWGTATPATRAFDSGGSTLTDFFCPPIPPACTDNDNDTYAVEGGDCGPVDCNDADAANQAWGNGKLQRQQG